MLFTSVTLAELAWLSPNNWLYHNELRKMTSFIMSVERTLEPDDVLVVIEGQGLSAGAPP